MEFGDIDWLRLSIGGKRTYGDAAIQAGRAACISPTTSGTRSRFSKALTFDLEPDVRRDAHVKFATSAS
ncbi:hypothetical protein CHELA40_11347 [Chelatococcus asaccharovorans]|nr:hypothetical protein CHELA40_11347 [Chelatococcus asaccharovorans]